MLRLRIPRRTLGFLCLLAALLCLLYGTVPNSPARPAAVADQPAAALPASTPSTDWFSYVTPPGIAPPAPRQSRRTSRPPRSPPRRPPRTGSPT